MYGQFMSSANPLEALNLLTTGDTPLPTPLPRPWHDWRFTSRLETVLIYASRDGAKMPDRLHSLQAQHRNAESQRDRDRAGAMYEFANQHLSGDPAQMKKLKAQMDLATRFRGDPQV